MKPIVAAAPSPQQTGIGTGMRTFMTARMPATEASTTALHHAVWPGFSLLPADNVCGHAFMYSATTGAGKSFLLQDMLRAAFGTPCAGGHHAQ
ncbi:hypothetical protein [Pantoea sp. At-9b]|uniref:hypothetical protein n=1 Tax=Pantoea sp. (strain At-9b) TaxID=592316 RepID=UPI0001B3EBC0|nr:hypothetical protein [Pantoea sp. At-9b]ADU72377.1 hypothetical protein Pat9b_5109 [Pantoea sp. At-9b]